MSKVWASFMCACVLFVRLRPFAHVFFLDLRACVDGRHNPLRRRLCRAFAFAGGLASKSTRQWREAETERQTEMLQWGGVFFGTRMHVRRVTVTGDLVCPFISTPLAHLPFSHIHTLSHTPQLSRISLTSLWACVHQTGSRALGKFQTSHSGMWALVAALHSVIVIASS